MTPDSNRIIILTGPTGVGKSDLSLKIAHAVNGEIINADMGQLYTPLTIGTAKPDWQSASVPHHLFDIVDEPALFSSFAYRQRVLSLIQNLWEAGKTPLLVGGSGFYIKSLFFPPHEPRIDTQKTFAQTTPVQGQSLWDELHAIDPERAGALHKNDIYRIQRALEIWRETSTLPSLYKPAMSLPGNCTLLFVTRDRQQLYQRINARTVQMINDIGWIDEVRSLQGTDWEPFLIKKKMIGYPEIFAFLQSSQSEHEKQKLIATIQQKTRHYAKKTDYFLAIIC